MRDPSRHEVSEEEGLARKARGLGFLEQPDPYIVRATQSGREPFAELPFGLDPLAYTGQRSAVKVVDRGRVVVEGLAGHLGRNVGEGVLDVQLGQLGGRGRTRATCWSGADSPSRT